MVQQSIAVAARSCYKSLHFLTLTRPQKESFCFHTENIPHQLCKNSMIVAANISRNVKTIHTISHQHGVLPASLTLPHRAGCFERNSDESSRSLRVLKRVTNELLHIRIHFSQTHIISSNIKCEGALFLHYIKCYSPISRSLSVVLPSTLSMKISRTDESLECQSPAEAAGRVSKRASFSDWNTESSEETPANIYCHLNKRVLWEHVQTSGPERSRLPPATTWHTGSSTWSAGWLKMRSLFQQNWWQGLKDRMSRLVSVRRKIRTASVGPFVLPVKPVAVLHVYRQSGRWTVFDWIFSFCHSNTASRTALLVGLSVFQKAAYLGFYFLFFGICGTLSWWEHHSPRVPVSG